MTKNDFFYILADAIQQHEGWIAGEASVTNNNPGNIKYVGQLGVTASPANFCVAPDFLTGKALQIHDLTLKLTVHNTIRDIISIYAPPSENNTEAYIAAVVGFFNRRNLPVTDTMPIVPNILSLPQEVALIVNNGQTNPDNWKAFQEMVDLVAKQMPEWAFSCRYVNHPLSAADTFATASPIGELYSVKEEVTRPIMALFNEGQKLNCLVYTILNLSNTSGGVQYGGEAVSFTEPATSFCNVYWNGADFIDGTYRGMFHEFIHSLFTLVGVKDTLHDYLLAHGGYRSNLLVDLQAVYADIISQYKKDTAVVQVEKNVIAVEQVALTKTPSEKQMISDAITKVVQFLKQLLFNAK